MKVAEEWTTTDEYGFVWTRRIEEDKFRDLKQIRKHIDQSDKGEKTYSHSKEYESPCDKYLIRTGSREKTRNLFADIILKETGEILTVINTGDNRFEHGWCIDHPNGNDYLISTGESWQSGSIINLTQKTAHTMVDFDGWYSMQISPKKDMLAVNMEYVMVIFDFTNPDNLLEIINTIDEYIRDPEEKFHNIHPPYEGDRGFGKTYSRRHGYFTGWCSDDEIEYKMNYDAKKDEYDALLTKWFKANFQSPKPEFMYEYWGKTVAIKVTDWNDETQKGVRDLSKWTLYRKKG